MGMYINLLTIVPLAPYIMHVYWSFNILIGTVLVMILYKIDCCFSFLTHSVSQLIRQPRGPVLAKGEYLFPLYSNQFRTLKIINIICKWEGELDTSCNQNLNTKKIHQKKLEFWDLAWVVALMR